MIKFRGKRVDNGEEVKGYYCEVQGKHIIIPAFKNSNSEVRPFIGATNGIQGYHEVIPETVAMYTGINDKERSRFFPNGKEIYGSIPINGEMSKGGDMVRANGVKIILGTIPVLNELVDVRSEYAVKWNNMFAQWSFFGKDTIAIDIDQRQYEVIGNQTDNPELLEKK